MSKTKPEKGFKYFADQFDDEDVIFVFRKHPVVMRKGLVLGLMGPLLGVLPAAIHPAYGMKGFLVGLGIGVAVGLLVFFPSWIGWYFSVFILTTQRFIEIKQKGLFTRSVSDLSLHQIQSVNYEIAGIQETLLGFGTITMRTYVGEVVIHDVHHPAKIQKKLVGILKELGITTLNYPTSVEAQSQTDEQIEEA
ncbi:PH domain-containing protein [Patescibacteria group bacterium]|jgi:uncharacterized integral membrane protein|nr:PH domain-containing protein [Patescibacteria group bacterium]